jgi:hypothetical protein
LDIVILAHKTFTGKAFHQIEEEFLRLMDGVQDKLLRR